MCVLPPRMTVKRNAAVRPTLVSIADPEPVRLTGRPDLAYRTSGSGSLLCQGRGFGVVECAPALVAVKVVRPVGRCTLTAPARRRGRFGAEAGWGFAAGGVAGSVCGAGPGSGFSEEPAPGCESVTLESESFPCCPPGLVFGAAEVVTVCVMASLSICW